MTWTPKARSTNTFTARSRAEASFVLQESVFTIDQSLTVGNYPPARSSRTRSFDSGGGSDRLLVVVVYTVELDITTTVTYAAVEMTRLTTQPRGDANRFINLFYLVNPSPGTNNIVATFSSATSNLIGAVSFTDADTSDPIDDWDASSTATSVTSQTASLTATVAGAIGVGCSWSPSGTEGTNADLLSKYDNFCLFQSADAPIGNSGVYNITIDQSSAYGGIIGVLVKPKPTFTPKAKATGGSWSGKPRA